MPSSAVDNVADNQPDPKLAGLEAMLFVSGSPVTVSRLAKALDVSEDRVRDLIFQLRSKYAAGSGLSLIEIGDEVQLGTAAETTAFVKKFVKEEFSEELTPAVLETLAIIAYRGPITRSEIDFIRGVNSTYILRTLLIRGLISRESDPKRQNVWLYRPSFDLLRFLGVVSAAELPDYETLSKKLTELADNQNQNQA